jgi:hypothetical protein
MPYPPTPSQTASNTPTPSITASVTPTYSPTGTVCPDSTPTQTPSNSPTRMTPTPTQTPTHTQTSTPTSTIVTTPTQTPTISPTRCGNGIWTICNSDCGGGTVNDVGINSNFIGTLPLGPSNFPLTSTLCGSVSNPGGVINGNNSIQVNHTTNIQGTSNCLAIFIFLNGNLGVPDFEYFTNSSSPINVVNDVYLRICDDVRIEIRCYEGACP